MSQIENIISEVSQNSGDDLARLMALREKFDAKDSATLEDVFNIDNEMYNFLQNSGIDGASQLSDIKNRSDSYRGAELFLTEEDIQAYVEDAKRNLDELIEKERNELTKVAAEEIAVASQMDERVIKELNDIQLNSASRQETQKLGYLEPHELGDMAKHRSTLVNDPAVQEKIQRQIEREANLANGEYMRP